MFVLLKCVKTFVHDCRPARLILASRTKVKSRPGSVADSEASLRRREKEKAEQEAHLRRDQLEWEIEQNREKNPTPGKGASRCEPRVKQAPPGVGRRN